MTPPLDVQAIRARADAASPGRLHFSAQPFHGPVVAWPKQEIGMKPKGFWWSVGDAWRDWCHTEDLNVKGCVHAVAVEVDESRILRLTTADDVLRFAHEYEADPYMGVALPTEMSRMAVDWPRVATKYSGIEIAPYHGSLRFDRRTRWYCSWDVASGCAWDAGVVRVLDTPSRAALALTTEETRDE